MAFPTTGLHARYEAKSETGYTSGDLLATIVDQSGGANDLVQATSAKQPTWQAAVLNGHPAFRLDGVDDVATRSAAVPVSALTLSAVIKAASDAGTRSWPFAATNDPGIASTLMALTKADTPGEWGSWFRTDAGTQRRVTTGVDMTVWSVLTMVWDGTNAAFYRDGSLVGSVAIAGSLSLNVITLGNAPTLSEFFGGDLALASMWTTALDAAARAALHSYVQDTYAITVADYAPSGVTGPLLRTSGGYLRTASGILRPA